MMDSFLAQASEPISPNLFWMVLCTMLGLVVAWGIFFLCMKPDTKGMVAIIQEGMLLRMLTVVFIICSTATLVTIDKFTAEVSTVYAGIAGFVLGGVQYRKRCEKGEQKGKAETDPTA